ncbi:MAG: hypothetical protein WD772_05990 [Pseudohongiellaceae bacterium]
MSKKNKQSERAGVYALCITIGVVVGIGLAPVVNNLILTLLIGTGGGALAGYLFDRQRLAREKHRHHHR